ncbi:hypothetical protein KIAC18_002105 [Sporomusa sphaeroides]
MGKDRWGRSPKTALSLMYCMGEELTLHAEQAIAAAAEANGEIHQNAK